MQKARRHSTKLLRPLVSTRFQVLFHSPVRGSFHLSLTVLVHYRSLSSIQPYQMVLVDSHKASPTSRYSGYQPHVFPYVYGTITLFCATSQQLQLRIYMIMSVLQPRCCRNNTGLGSYAFARHYLRNHYCFLFLCLLRCFSSAGLRCCNIPSVCQVAPFGYLRIKSYLRIPAAFRSLSRPSSPLRAKASSVCPFLLSLIYTLTGLYFFQDVKELYENPQILIRRMFGREPTYPSRYILCVSYQLVEICQQDFGAIHKYLASIT